MQLKQEELKTVIGPNAVTKSWQWRR